MKNIILIIAIIFSLSGKIVFRGNVKDAHLPNGVYILKDKGIRKIVIIDNRIIGLHLTK